MLVSFARPRCSVSAASLRCLCKTFCLFFGWVGDFSLGLGDRWPVVPASKFLRLLARVGCLLPNSSLLAPCRFEWYAAASCFHISRWLDRLFRFCLWLELSSLEVRTPTAVLFSGVLDVRLLMVPRMCTALLPAPRVLNVCCYFFRGSSPKFDIHLPLRIVVFRQTTSCPPRLTASCARTQSSGRHSGLPVYRV